LETNLGGVDFSGTQVTRPAAPPATAPALACDLVLAAGMHPMDAREAAPLLARLGAPIIAEATANLHGMAALQPLLVPGGERALQYAKPAHVLRIGGVPSWRWWRDLDLQADIRVTNITRTGFSGLARRENVATLAWETVLSAQASLPGDANAVLRFEPEAELAKFPLSEPGWMAQILQVIPAGSRVFLGNSLPIREANLALRTVKPGVEFYANRGANGIDGLVSSFLGMGARHRGESWLILGDLSALYDLAGPWIISQLHMTTLRIVVINNGGGKIFSRVNSLRALPEAARGVIENRHALSFEPWARMWGIEYVQIEDPQDLHDLLPVPMIIEIRPDPLETEAFWKDWQKPVIRPR